MAKLKQDAATLSGPGNAVGNLQARFARQMEVSTLAMQAAEESLRKAQEALRETGEELSRLREAAEQPAGGVPTSDVEPQILSLVKQLLIGVKEVARQTSIMEVQQVRVLP